MLNATKWEYPVYKTQRDRTRREPQNGRQVHESHEKTTCIEVQHYLDFKYGTNSVDITLPDNSTIKLVVGADGRVFFQVPLNG